MFILFCVECSSPLGGGIVSFKVILVFGQIKIIADARKKMFQSSNLN